MEPYFTIFVPWAPPEFTTEWHPTTSEGPFATLSRGAFPTMDAAIRWGKERLNGTPYTVKRIDPLADGDDTE